MDNTVYEDRWFWASKIGLEKLKTRERVEIGEREDWRDWEEIGLTLRNEEMLNWWLIIDKN